jgi:hypothetical protein
MTKRRSWAYFRNASLNRGLGVIRLIHDRRQIIRGNDLKEPTEEKPLGGLEPSDHFIQGLAVGG